MAPIPLDTVEDDLKDVIQLFYEIQSSVHGYLGPETQRELARQLASLTTSLSEVAIRTAPSNSRAYQLPLIPPEIVSYVDSARNPDIYTREFVEIVQKGNKILKGKSEAFASFRDILAEEMSSTMPELKGEVDRVIDASNNKNGAPENETQS